VNRTDNASTRSRTITPWRLVCVAGIGSLWGMSELMGGETLRLTATALVLLAVGRMILDLPGSSIVIAGIAVLFRWANAAPFYCHLAGIALLGVSFDVMATWLLRGEHNSVLRGALTGAGCAYLSAFLFAASMAWIFGYRSWPTGGLERVAGHVASSGSRAALAGFFAVPLGLWIGRGVTGVAARHPHRLLAAMASACALLWAIGPFVT
jgi:hypothetical protein